LSVGFNQCHGLEFLNELLGQDTSVSTSQVFILPGRKRLGKVSRELHGQRIVRVEPRIPIGSFIARGEFLA
jgi:hypothetical protein